LPLESSQDGDGDAARDALDGVAVEVEVPVGVKMGDGAVVDMDVMDEVGKRIVRPSVRSDFVPFRDHPLDQSWAWRDEINLPLSIVVANNEKHIVETVLLESTKWLLGFKIWSILIAQSNDIALDAIIDIIRICDRFLQ
jgi:hypothetical protein